MVEAAFPHDPESEVTIAVARRLLTHPDAERLVGGLLGRFFGDLAGDVDERARAERKARKPAAQASSAPPPARRREPKSAAPSGAPPEAEEAREGEDGGAAQTTLYINLGRKDDVRSSDLRELLTQGASVDEADIGKVRVRDRHSFVQVTPEKAEAILAKLNEATFRGREIMAEVARIKA
jgi:ATP-dependent RNA helicase DeaD